MHPIQPQPTQGSFNGLGLSPQVLEILEKLKLTTPTPIQLKAIPQGVEGRDLIGVAQTGTGKTFAFGLPLLQKLSQGTGTALILVPTRELAAQVYESLTPFGRGLSLSATVLIGGASMGKQISDLRFNPRVIIATPGRLLDHMRGRTVHLETISTLVIDEADRMLDMGFWPQIKEILSSIPHDRQTMLFSATLSREITDLAHKHMKTPTSIEVAPPGTTADKVSQEFFFVRKSEKLQLLESVLGARTGSAIVFSRTKHGAKKIAKVVSDMGHTVTELHSNKSLAQRKVAMEGFKNGRYRIMVATDIAARGIDVKNIELVVNYDMPMKTEDYVHRIGRTARAGTEGHAISFVMPDERSALRHIERLIRKQVTISQLPHLPPARVVVHTDEPEEERRGFGARPQRAFGGGGRSHSRPSFSNRPPRGKTFSSRPRWK